MNARKHIPFIASALMLLLLVAFYYPYCKYYVDPDATSYLTISKLYADGDWLNAVNGYWSPWSCWLTAVFIRLGTTAIDGAIIANAIGAVLLLRITHSFFIRYSINAFAQQALGIASAVFLAYAVYYQNYDDIWECFFLLYAMRLMVSHKFRHTPVYWLGAGVLGALAYFAKAYAFPFFTLSTLVIVFYNTRAWRRANRVEWLKISAVMIGVMVILSSPWIYALHHKYGMWTTGTAGKLNMSWYLVGHPYWKEGIGYLLPAGNGISYWQDPWLVNGETPQFWSSTALFIRQLMKLVQNSYKFTVSSLMIGVGFLAVWVYMVWLLLFRKATRQKYRAYYPIIIPYILFPLPFFLINFEPRYIWYMLPISMVLGTAIVKRNRLFSKKLVVALFALSYVIWPIWDMQKMWNVGKAEYQIARQLKEKGIKGKMGANLVYGKPGSTEMQRLAYFSGNPYFIMHNAPATFQKLLPELRRYNIRYYYYHTKYNTDWQLVDEHGSQYRVAYEDTLHGFRILDVRGGIAESFISDLLESFRRENEDTLYLMRQTPVLTLRMVGRTLPMFFRVGEESDTVTSLRKLKEFMPLETAVDIVRQLSLNDSLLISDYRKYYGVELIDDSLYKNILLAMDYDEERKQKYIRYAGNSYQLSLPVFDSRNEYAVIRVDDIIRRGFHGEEERIWIYHRKNATSVWQLCGKVL